MKRILKTVVFLMFLIVSITLKSQNDTTEIIILHTNDIHAKIENFSKLAALVEDYKKNYENVFLFSAGDLFTGNPIVDQYEPKGLPVIELMNILQYDLSCLGNHEFDYGQNNLVYLMNKATFPFICSNVYISDRSDFKLKKEYMKLYTKDSISIGVLGLIEIGKNGLPASNPDNLYGLTFSNPIKTAKKFKTYKDSSDIYIALSHLGFKQDIKLAKKHSFFDIIIGGHSHTKLVNGHKTDNTLIVQADSYLNYVGVLKIYISNREIISKSDTLIGLYSYESNNEEVAKMIEEYNSNSDFDKVIGYAKNDIVGNDELGALMTDAIQDTLDVDISFQNNGGIRLDRIPAGEITLKQIYALSPFGNNFIVYNLNPKQIKKLIKYSYNLHKFNELQVSGIHIDLYSKKNYQFKKIILKDTNGNILKNKLYKVAINNYMAAAYNIKFLKKGTVKNINDAESTIDFIKKEKQLTTKVLKE